MNTEFLRNNPEIRDMLNFDRDLIYIARPEDIQRRSSTFYSLSSPKYIQAIELMYDKPRSKIDFYRMFLSMVINGQDLLDIIYENISEQETYNLVDLAKQSFYDMGVIYPEYFTFFSSVKIDVFVKKNKIEHLTKFTFKLEGKQLDRIAFTIKMATYVINCLRSSNKINDYMSEYQKARVIFQWVVLHTKYPKNIKEEDYTPYGLFYNGVGVCQAFTGAFNLLCKMENIKVIGIAGQVKNYTEEHIWSYIKLDNTFSYVDCTWASPLFINEDLLVRYNINPEEICNFKYFNVYKTDLEKTHNWNRFSFEYLLENNILFK